MAETKDPGPQLGQLVPEGENRRDAIHIAVAPMVAREFLTRGEHVGLLDGLASKTVQDKIGIVDPFLTGNVVPGERFWLLLYPNTITSLRHVWSHPAFTALVEKAAKEALEAIKKAVRT